MTFNLDDLLNGFIPSGLTVHLSTVPLAVPYRLDTLTEATFPGYAPAEMIFLIRQGYDSGFGYLSGYTVFTNADQENPVKVLGAWLTAKADGKDQLLSVLYPFPGGGLDLPPGDTTLQTRWTSFAKP